MGFLGLGNYSKPGKGVRKDEPKKKRFFLFFEIYFRKFFNLLKLNLLYVLFCIPIVTIGPATAAMTKICRCYNEEKPVFLWSDFWDAFKANFKQGMIIGILDILLTALMCVSFVFYFQHTYESWFYYIPLGLVMMISLITIFANFYIYLMMVTVDLKTFQLIKNAVLFAFLGMKTNFLTLIFAGIVMVPSILFFPITVPILLLLTFSTTTMITSFNSWQYIYLYMVRPYYLKPGGS